MTRAPRIPRVLRGMGDLVDVEVILPDGREATWAWRGQLPILAFDRVSEDTSGKTRARLYVVGGDYRVEGGKLRCGRAKPLRARSVARVSKEHAAVAADFARTHGGLSATVARACRVPHPSSLTRVARVVAITYRADKSTHGLVLYRHAFEGDARPYLAVSETGRQLWFRGGRYTVTPHGIEDLDD